MRTAITDLFTANKNIFIFILILLSGFAALSWEVIWQLKISIALGISAWGTALTLAVMMGGMCLGSLIMGMIIRDTTSPIKALRIYGALELLIGIFGLLLHDTFQMLEQLDSWTYAIIPGSTSIIYLLAMVVSLSIPSFCMGATIPAFNIIARQINIPLSKLYSINTFGAAISILCLAMIIIPTMGVKQTTWLIVTINLFIFMISWILPLHPAAPDTVVKHHQTSTLPFSAMQSALIVFVTGFATFTLEVAWFRSLNDTMPNTTDVFATILACTLIAISLAAKDVVAFKEKNKSLATQLILAGLFILLLTPIIERLDINYAYSKYADATALPQSFSGSLKQANVSLLFHQDTLVTNSIATLTYAIQMIFRFFLLYFILVPPMRLLALAFPWIIDSQSSTRTVGKLYAINTAAAIIGSISAGWLLLPTIGFTKTACLSGVIIIIAGLIITPHLYKRLAWIGVSLVALSIPILFNSGIGKTRVQGFYGTDNNGIPAKVLAYHEGPQATVAAVEYVDESRALLINSIGASWESGKTMRPSIHYMAWMGHLPMILHPNPEHALVICFGTGQTANAIRNEIPLTLDIVDVNANVFKLAPYFRSNQGVLNDPRVNAIVMDGRAYLRRSKKAYDVITLEPMPPNNANVNALYSREFYQLAKQRLRPDGIIAQWLPLHIVSPYYTASIAKTFIDVFPNAILWLDQASHSSILIGWKNDRVALGSVWPGLSRQNIVRDLTQNRVKESMVFDSYSLAAYAKYGEVITDDNQLLSYGKALQAPGLMLDANFQLLQRINNKISDPVIDRDYQ